MKSFTLIISAIFMAMSTSVLAAAQDSPADQALAKIHTRLISAHPQLSHISAAEMTAALAGQDDILLLDVRKEKEYAVSHIDGALRVDPGISADEFMQIYGEQLAGKNVILYCSVGRRSSHLGDKLRPRPKSRTWKAVFLAGIIIICRLCAARRRPINSTPITHGGAD
jgi:rhodanese-related sulfurtransferase